MKLSGQRLEKFLRGPDSLIVAALVYGPDHGLVRERADRMVQAVAGTLSDPFRVAELTAECLREDRARLADAAASLPLSGGRRVVRVRDGKDALVDAVRNLLEVGGGGGYTVIEAGELGPRSPLRMLFEAAETAAAIPCYVDEGEALHAFIGEEIARGGFTIADEALDLLAAHLGADRGLTRRELEKLALYKGEPGPIGVVDVLAIVGEASTLSLDAVAYAACGGDFAALDRAMVMASGESIGAIPLLRVAARHLQRLLQAQAWIASGRSAAQAMAALKPAVFFRLQPAFRRQLDVWNGPRLAAALVVLAETELNCKRTGAPHDILCHAAFVHIARMAQQRSRG